MDGDGNIIGTGELHIVTSDGHEYKGKGTMTIATPEKTEGEIAVEILSINAAVQAETILRAILNECFAGDHKHRVLLNSQRKSLIDYLTDTQTNLFLSLVEYQKFAAEVWKLIHDGAPEEAAMLALAMAGALQNYDKRVDAARERAGLPMAVKKEYEGQPKNPASK